jgi:hypothetical protein
MRSYINHITLAFFSGRMKYSRPLCSLPYYTRILFLLYFVSSVFHPILYPIFFYFYNEPHSAPVQNRGSFLSGSFRSDELTGRWHYITDKRPSYFVFIKNDTRTRRGQTSVSESAILSPEDE